MQQIIKSKYRVLLILIFFVGLTSCQTGYVISDTPLSLKSTRKAFVVVLGQVRTVSINGREVYSYYHDRNFKTISDPTSVQQRYYTKLIILGPRRPYDVDVQVHEEVKSEETGGYEDLGIDEDLSEIRSEAVKKVLNQSRGKMVNVDGEDPF